MNNEEQLVWDILSTPNNADFKEYRKQHRNTWLTKDRKILLMRDMETKHLISCMNMLEALKQEYTEAYAGIIDELRKRG
jgi:deoxyadenosine/deoxycytidine kinase